MRACGGLQLGEHALKSGLKTALLGRSQLFGNEKSLQAYEGLLDVLQAPLEGDGGWGAHRGGRGLGPHQVQGRPEQLPPVPLVGHAVSREERESLWQPQAVALCGAQEGVLVFLGQAAEGVGQCGTDGAAGKFLLGQRSEPSSDLYPTSHPPDFVPQQTGHSGGAQSLLAHQRADHPSLIQSGKGARR